MLPDLESLRCFIEAARLLNFRAASRAVGLTPAALGQRIRQLEDQVGAPLFQRTTRSVIMTEAGINLVPYAKRALASAKDCLRVVGGDLAPAPVELVLGTRHELGLSWIVPMLPKLAKAIPGLNTQLYFGSGDDLVIRVRSVEIDCAIASTRLSDPKLDAIKLHQEDYVFVATPEHLRKTPLKTVADAKHHTLIDIGNRLPLFGYWRDAPGAIDSVHFAGVLQMGTIAAIRALVLRSQGVAVLPEYFVRNDLAKKRLTVIMPKVKPAHDFFRLIFRSDDPRRKIYQAMADTMQKQPLR